MAFEFPRARGESLARGLGRSRRRRAARCRCYDGLLCFGMGTRISARFPPRESTGSSRRRRRTPLGVRRPGTARVRHERTRVRARWPICIFDAFCPDRVRTPCPLGQHKPLQGSGLGHLDGTVNTRNLRWVQGNVAACGPLRKAGILAQCNGRLNLAQPTCASRRPPGLGRGGDALRPHQAISNNPLNCYLTQMHFISRGGMEFAPVGPRPACTK